MTEVKEAPAAPWMSVRDVKCIEAILQSMQKPKVLEWGSGGSTLYFSQYADLWITIEHMKEWADAVTSSLKSDNVKLFLCEDPVSYLNPFSSLPVRKFDVIFVDGIMREICLFEALSRLRDNGLCILHDARRAQYQSGWAQWEWKQRIGDDMMVMAKNPPNKSMMKLLKKFDARGYNTGSYLWHESHFKDLPEGHNIPYSGFPYARNNSR